MENKHFDDERQKRFSENILAVIGLIPFIGFILFLLGVMYYGAQGW